MGKQQSEDRRGSLGDSFLAVYPELRREAHALMWKEVRGSTLQTTALVNEVYLRLAKSGRRWSGACHVLQTGRKIMRHVLVDRARRKRTLRRGRGLKRVPLEEHKISEDRQKVSDRLGLDESLLHLADWDRDAADVVRLRYFHGLTVEETARKLGVSPRKVDKDWQFAKAWLRRQLG